MLDGSPHSPRDVEGSIRRYIRAPSSEDREFLARYAYDYIFVYLQCRLSGGRFGDWARDDHVPRSVADWTVATLFPVEELDGRPGGTLLEEELLRVRAKLSPDSATPGIATEEKPLLFFRACLRGAAARNTTREWKEVRPELRKINRTLKDRLKRHDRLEVRPNRHGRGMIRPAGADRVRPLDGEAGLFAAVFLYLRDSAAGLNALADLLEDGSEGRCVPLCFVVHAVHQALQGLLGHGGGAGLPEADRRLLFEDIHRIARVEAARLVDGDRAKRRGGAAEDPRVRGAWIRVTEEMTARRFGAGEEGVDGVSQEKLLGRCLPEVDAGEYAKTHRNPIDYLVRRTRDRLLDILLSEE